MKRFRHYAGLWGILTSSFIIFTAASSFDSISIGRHELKSSGLSQAIFGKAQTEDVQSAPVFENDTVSIIQSCNPEPVPVDTAAQTILIIGDSMLEGLVPRLAAYSDHNGHKLYAAMWYSSTSAVWGRSRKLQRYIERLHPTFIIVSLGANELFVTDIRRKRERYVRNILDQIGEIPYLWIGPPNWKADTGINSLLRDATADGCFFLSDGMQFRRAKDGAHPTRESAAEWVDSIMRWMPKSAAHPILMHAHTEAKGRPAKLWVHQPDEKDIDPDLK